MASPRRQWSLSRRRMSRAFACLPISIRGCNGRSWKHLGEGHADEMQEIRRNHRAVMQQVLLAHKSSPVQEKELMAYHDGHIASLENGCRRAKWAESQQKVFRAE